MAFAHASVDDAAVDVTSLSDRVWGFAEPGLREYRSAETLSQHLRTNGFDVVLGVADMPTAFLARWGTGAPTIGLMCEYDATPGDSQRAVPRPSEIDRDACGFPDLHNGIGAASAGAAVAVKRALEAFNLPGSIVVFGTPAEKLCVGKPFMARAGLFDDLDAVIAWHPRPYTTVEWDSGPGCYRAEIFDFFGVSAYGATPWSGVSALDAMALMNVNVQFLREHIHRRFVASVNELVTIGGQHPTSLPPHTQVWYVYRSPIPDGVEAVGEMLGRAANAACLAIGARFERRLVAATRPWLPNHVLAEHCHRQLAAVGGPRFPAESKDFGRQILAQLGLPDDPEPFDVGVAPIEANVTLDRAGGTDDVSEFCWHAPTARIYVAHSLKVGRLPNWVGASLAGTRAAHATVLTAARAVARSTVGLIGSPATLDAAKTEFHSRTDGRRMAPLLPAEARPPVDDSFAPHFPRGWRPPADRTTER